MASPTTTDRRTLIEAVVASTVGTTIEWYDFFLVGIAAAFVIGPLFFPALDPVVGQIAAFGAYGVGFVARPLGGAFFGWMGDRVGRKSTLVTTLLLMGISTMLMGALPTYATIGVWAPLALVSLRFIQGLGVGGEWGGAVLLALEYSQGGKRGFHASWPQAGVPLGLVSSIAVVALVRGSMTEAEFFDWGWRIPFFLSGLLIAVGLLIRVRILETPLFAKLLETKQVAEAPLREALTKHWREILLAAGSRIAENACFYLFSIWVLDYAKHLEVDPSIFLWSVAGAAILALFTMPLFGALSDRWSRKGIYLLGNVLLALLAFPYFAMLHTRQTVWIVVAVLLSLAVVHAMLYSVQASLIPELFGTRLRYTGASVGYQLGAPLGGGLAPIIAVWLVYKFPQQYWPLALYIILVALLSLACVLRLAETSRKDISTE